MQDYPTLAFPNLDPPPPPHTQVLARITATKVEIFWSGSIQRLLTLKSFIVMMNVAKKKR
jgi:hypothetical protein